MDGGLFRISRLDEAPAHEGPDELAEEPAYEREFPLDDDPLSIDTEPDVEEPVDAPVRSPEPPDWTPPPLGPPPPPPLLPPVAPPSSEPELPTEAMSAPLPLETDHDGLTGPGRGSRPRRRRPASPASRPRRT